MAHQIPPHLVFCTPGQNQETEQGTNPNTSKSDTTKSNRNKNKHTSESERTELHVLNESWKRKE